MKTLFFLAIALNTTPEIGERVLHVEKHGSKTTYTIMQDGVSIDSVNIAGECDSWSINTRSDEWVCSTENRTYYLKLLAEDKVRI